MFLKRVDGPRQVTLPDGSILSRADLPPGDTRRWVASRKAVVVRAVVYGLISEKEALERYALSEEEFAVANSRRGMVMMALKSRRSRNTDNFKLFFALALA